MRSSRVVRASDSQCRSSNCPGFDPSILRHSGIWGAADEAALNIEHKKSEKAPLKINYLPLVLDSWSIQCVFFPPRESIRRSLRKFRKNKNKEDKDIQIQKEEEQEEIERRSRKASYELSISYSREDIHNIETQSIGGQSRRKVKIFLMLIYASLFSCELWCL